MYLLGRDALILGLFLSNQPLGLESSHTSRPSGRDGLPVLLVLDITRGEHALDGGLGGAGDSEDVAVCVKLELRLDKSSSGFVTFYLARPAATNSPIA